MTTSTAAPAPWIGFREDVCRVWHEHPNLGVHGFAIRPPLRHCDGLVEQVADVVAWMSRPDAARLMNGASSYRIKHQIEAANRRYIANGAVIAAGLVLGMELLPPMDPTSPNRRFGRSR